jgi:uncharacterized protein (TIGR00730 family)
MRKKTTKKAYKSPRFLNSPDARVLRILAEYMEPLQRLRRHQVKDTIVFFGSARAISRKEAEKKYQSICRKINRQSSSANALQTEFEESKRLLHLAEYYEDAKNLAGKLTKWSLGLKHNQRFVICSGGGGGIMEAANRGAKEAGGPSIGMNISIPFEQALNPFISDDLDFEFHYFFMRKFWVIYLAKAVVIFTGGFGTMDELFEVLTLIQTQKVRKRVPIMIYGEEYWNKVFNFDSMLEMGTISKEDLDLCVFSSNVGEAFEYLRTELTDRFLKKRGHKYWYL